MKQIRFNVAGTPTDVPRVQDDTPTTWLGRFEGAAGAPPNRCIFDLPDTAIGGGHLYYSNKSVNFLLPPPGSYEASQLGLEPLIYGSSGQPASDMGLRIVGSNFFDKNGLFLWKGVTDFRLLDLIGEGQDIDGLLDERAGLGFNLVRVLSMKTNNTGWDLNPKTPGYWEATEILFEKTQRRKLYVEMVVFADTASMMPRYDEQVQHLNRMSEVARRYPHVLEEFMNEYGHSTQAINPAQFVEPQDVLASHGSGLTDAHPVTPFWDYATYHARREPDARGFTNVDPYEFERDYPKPCPLVCEEMIKPQDHGFSIEYSERIGQHAACGVGATFHWDGVNSPAMPTNVQRCAEAFIKGIERSRS